MSNSVSSTGSGRNTSAEVEARRKEILRAGEAAGGSQARAVESGARRAAALRWQSSGSAPSAKTSQKSSAASSAAATSSTSAPKRTGWEVTLDDASYAAMKKATAGQTGSKLDITA